MKIFLILNILLFLFFQTTLLRADELDPLEKIQEEIKTDKLLLKKMPDNAIVLNRLGFNLYRLGNINESVYYYKQSIKNNPKLSVVYNNLGSVYLKQNDFLKAEENFLKAIELSKISIKPLYNLAVTYFHQKRYYLAIKTYLKAKNLDGNYIKQRDDKVKLKKELNNHLKDDPNNEILLKISSEIKKDEKKK